MRVINFSTTKLLTSLNKSRSMLEEKEVFLSYEDLHHTNWDLSDCTNEQKAEWQETMFGLGFNWKVTPKEVNNLEAKSYQLWPHPNRIGYYSEPKFIPLYGKEKWRYYTYQDYLDMFKKQPLKEPVVEEVTSHDCRLHYYSSLQCCIKCNPEKDPNNKLLWGILNEERVHEEFVAQFSKGKGDK